MMDIIIEEEMNFGCKYEEGNNTNAEWHFLTKIIHNYAFKNTSQR